MLDLDLVGIVDEDAPLVQIVPVELIRLLVEGDEDVTAVADGEDGPVGDPDLEPGVAALDLRRIGTESECPKALVRCGSAEVFAGADHAANSSVAAYPYHEIIFRHAKAPCYAPASGAVPYSTPVDAR